MVINPATGKLDCVGSGGGGGSEIYPSTSTTPTPTFPDGVNMGAFTFTPQDIYSGVCGGVVSELGIQDQSGTIGFTLDAGCQMSFSLSGIPLFAVNSTTIQSSLYNCTSKLNGGKLTADSSGNFVCADDMSGGGGGASSLQVNKDGSIQISSPTAALNIISQSGLNVTQNVSTATIFMTSNLPGGSTSYLAVTASATFNSSLTQLSSFTAFGSSMPVSYIGISSKPWSTTDLTYSSAAVSYLGISSNSFSTTVSFSSGIANTKRVVTAADGTSITPNTNSADITYQLNTQSVGTLNINADTGQPIEGRSWILKIKSTNVQTYSWNTNYVGGTTALPTASTGGGKLDYYSFIYDTVNSKWTYVGGAGGF